MRRVIELGDDPTSSDGVMVTAHRRGITIFGWHGAFGNGEPIELTWAQVEDAHQRVDGKESLGEDAAKGEK